MNEKDNETSHSSWEESENLESGPIPEKEEDFPEEETLTSSDEKPEEDIEVSPESPEEEKPVAAFDEESEEEPEEEA